MKSFLGYLLAGILLVLICFFSFNIFLKTYFNEKFYTTPNLIGFNMEQASKIEDIDNLNLTVLGADYSNMPAGTIFRQTPLPEKVVKKGRTIGVWISKGKDDYIVPDFLNKNLIAVLASLQRDGISVHKTTYTESTLPYNTVLATTPAPGESTQKNLGISLLLSNSNSLSSTEVPDTIGFTFKEAEQLLLSKGLIIGEVERQFIPNLEPGIVIKTSQIGEVVPRGSLINMIISK